jgi:hypothetical protein
MGEVTITIPAEHQEAVRDDLLETLGLLATELESKAADIERLVAWLRGGQGTRGQIRLKAETPGDRRGIRKWAEAARSDGEETLRDIDTYYDAEWWEARSRSLLAVSEHALERVQD